MLGIHEGVTSRVCEVVVVTVNENVSPDYCGVVVVAVDDDVTSGILRVVTVDEGVSSGVCEIMHEVVTVDDDVSPDVCKVVEKLVHEDITSGVRGVVPLTVDDVTSEVGITSWLFKGEEVTADDVVTSGICSVVETLVAILREKNFTWS